MTLLEIATRACEFVGDTSAAAILKAKAYCATNYERLWYAYPWPETFVRVQETIAANLQRYNDYGQVINMVNISTGKEVQKVDWFEVNRMSPQYGYDTTQDGNPKLGVDAGSVSTNTDQSNFRFYPRADGNDTFMIVAKFAPTPLVNDTDFPIIGRIEFPLIEYTTADMLRSYRQYGRAAAQQQLAEKYLADVEFYARGYDIGRKPKEARPPQ
jgi:hypothetical protein